MGKYLNCAAFALAIKGIAPVNVEAVAFPAAHCVVAIVATGALCVRSARVGFTIRRTLPRAKFERLRVLFAARVSMTSRFVYINRQKPVQTSLGLDPSSEAIATFNSDARKVLMWTAALLIRASTASGAVTHFK